MGGCAGWSSLVCEHGRRINLGHASSFDHHLLPAGLIRARIEPYSVLTVGATAGKPEKSRDGLFYRPEPGLPPAAYEWVGYERARRQRRSPRGGPYDENRSPSLALLGPGGGGGPRVGRAVPTPEVAEDRAALPSVIFLSPAPPVSVGECRGGEFANIGGFQLTIIIGV